jgi:hypothetical protein
VCDTVVVVRAGEVWLAKNSDRDPNEAQLLEWTPRRTHARGARVRCTTREVAQMPETFGTLVSRPFWMWGAEMGTNEHGVTIGNEAVFTRQAVPLRGLLGMDVLRLALVRADTAARAVDVVRALFDEHGQGGGAGLEDPDFRYHSSFLIADPQGAFVLETAGREAAVEEIVGVRSISNGLTIPGFAERHSDLVRTRFSRCRVRRARTEQLARAARTPADLAQLLRDHGTRRTEPAYSILTGAMDMPCMHAGGLVAASQTTASWVSVLSPGGSRHWATGTAAPCTGLFKPVRVDAPLRLGAPTDTADPASLFWRHERLHRRVLADPGALLPLYRAERDALEAGWFARPPEPATAFAEGDLLLAEWLSRVSARRGRDVRPGWARRYWERRTARAGH